MIQLKIKDDQIEINRNTSISIEYKSPVWMGEEVDTIPGAVVIPFTIPLTRANNSKLGFLDSFGNRKRRNKIKDAALLINGNVHLYGTMEIEKISNGEAVAKIYGGVGALQDFKEYKINEGILYASNPNYTHNLANMNNSLTTVGDVLFVPLHDGTNLYNSYNSEHQVFSSAADAVPFYNATHLLDQLLAGQGYSLKWRDRSIYEKYLHIVCNTSVNANFKKTAILPPVLAVDFIKEMAAVVGCFIDVDTTTKTLSLVRYDYLNKGAAEDWTSKILSTTEKQTITATYERDFTNHFFDKYFGIFETTINNETIQSFQSYPVIPAINIAIEKPRFIMYRGLVEPAFNQNKTTGQGGLHGYHYPLASTEKGEKYTTNETLVYLGWKDAQNAGIHSLYAKWSQKIKTHELVTFEAYLTQNDVKKYRPYKKVCIFNAKDGHSYHFLVKSIKENINTNQRETQTIECILLD
jgi:hypothetical protein